MLIEHIEVYGFRAALRGMRNPGESWARSDTEFGLDGFTAFVEGNIICAEQPMIGPKDLELACKLIRSGTDHRKFLRQIMIWWDITIPRCVWQELDTYKVATVRNSCSTMYKLGSRDLTEADFELGDVDPDTLDVLNYLGKTYRAKSPVFSRGRELRGADLLAHMKRQLPEGYLQKATYSFNYETALAVYRSRHDHRMPEWSSEYGICAKLRELPYLAVFIDAAMGRG